jgi:hypothetical protein
MLVSKMQNADPGKFYPLSGRGNAHKILVHGARNCVACHQRVAFADKIMGYYLRVWEYSPKGII